MAEENVNEEVEDQEVIPPEPVVDPEIEDRAKLMGWSPKEEFRGDPERWRPAEEYVQRGEDLMPLLKSQLKKYESNITDLTSKVETQAETMKRMAKVSETVSDRAYEKAVDDLERKQLDAVAKGDTEGYVSLKREEKNLQKPEPIEIPESDQGGNGKGTHPEFQPWLQDNPWYKENKTLSDYADGIKDYVAVKNPNLNGTALKPQHT